jgi:hypothetical protein
MKNHYPIDSNFFAKKLKIFTFAYKNTIFFSYKQGVVSRIFRFKREKDQLLCKAYVIPLQIPFSSHSKERIRNGLVAKVERRYNEGILLGVIVGVILVS